MSGKNTFDRVMRERSQRQPKKNQQFSGFLGIRTGGKDVVSIDSRPGFVWVRLRNVDNEVIQAFNETTSTIYNLPVMVERDLSSPNRYKVTGRDIGVYGSNWGTASPYLANHAGQHMFAKNDVSTGGDVVWIYSDQFLPFLVSPSGTFAGGAGNVLVFPHIYHYNGGFHYAGNTGTSNVLPYKPTGTITSRMLLVYLDEPTGNPLLIGGSEFSSSISGTSNILGYVPDVPNNAIPLAAIRLETGTSYVGWNDLYDLRPLVSKAGSGTSGGSSSFLGLSDTKSNYNNGSLLYWNGSYVDEDGGLLWDDTDKNIHAGETLNHHNSDHSALFGESNSVSGSFNLVCGDSNSVNGNDCLVSNYNNYVSGIENTVLAPNSTVIGGVNFIGGGDSNEIHNDECAILGSYESWIYGYMGIILGGNNVMVSGSYAMAHGNVAHADHDGSIVFAAGQYGDGVFSSEVEDEFAVRAFGGHRLVATSGTFYVDNIGNAHIELSLLIDGIKSGATQVAAGAGANEIWKTLGHTSLVDNVLMIGV